MSSNVGLTTPRGSGTSGYVQRNLSVLKTRDQSYGQPYPDPKRDLPRQRKPDKDILDHDRKREVEVKVFDLRDKLEEEGVHEDEIDDRCEKLRLKLLDEGGSSPDLRAKGKNLKPHQVHELAEAKIKESERLRKALKLKKEDVDNDNKRPTEGFGRPRTE
ncbi:MAG: hypothetical protein Q9160_001115 [Pyrenula sp. 1 TL-2023]